MNYLLTKHFIFYPLIYVFSIYEMISPYIKMYWNHILCIIERMIVVSVDLSNCLPYNTLINYIKKIKNCFNTL